MDYDSRIAQVTNLSKAMNQLRNNATCWKSEIEKHGLRGTLLIGIASKTAREFDKLLRDLLKFYLSVCGASYDQMLRNHMQGKDLNKLTMGEVLKCFSKMNMQFTNECRRLLPPNVEHLKTRSLLPKSVEKQLDEIIKLRNKLIHPQELAKGEATLENETGQMLTLVHDILADVLFDLVLIYERERNQV